MLDAYELARFRQEGRHREMHPVAITGYRSADHREDASTVGFDVHLVKAAELGELRQLAASRQRHKDLDGWATLSLARGDLATRLRFSW